MSKPLNQERLERLFHKGLALLDDVQLTPERAEVFVALMDAVSSGEEARVAKRELRIAKRAAKKKPLSPAEIIALAKAKVEGERDANTF